MQETTQLFTLFKQFAYGQNYSTAFIEILDYFLIPFKVYSTTEEQQKAFTVLTNHKKKEALVLLLTEVGQLAEGFHDPFGELYERLISKGQHGQFFTPEPIADFMASCVLHDQMQPGQTVYDPACGSGRMLLAAANINRHLHFYGADIDLVCCKITVVNFMLQSLTGEVAHMDTLANDFYCGFKTGTVLKDGYYYPCFKEFTDSEESSIWLRPSAPKSKAGFDTPFNPPKSAPMNGVQGTLF